VKQNGLTLLEVVVVVAIVAVLGVIAIPRMSRGTQGGREIALVNDLRVLRDAIERYTAEHDGSYPTCKDIAGQLTRYTDSTGDIQASRDETHLYGPYLRSVPPLPVGLKKGSTGIAKKSGTGGPNVGWVYDEATGVIYANCVADELDRAWQKQGNRRALQEDVQCMASL